MNIQEAFDKHVATIPKLDAGMFLRGEKDCLDGVAHEDGKGNDYDRGYAARYEMEQLLGEIRWIQAVKLMN